MDVHLPHKRIDSWREFFIHLATITVGLLIALGLEGAVEWKHHRNLVHEAGTNIRLEITDNQNLLKKDIVSIQRDEERIAANLQLLSSLRKNHVLPKDSKLSYTLEWSGFDDSAWKTARDTGALGYMEYKEVQGFADLYSEQDIVNARAVELFHEQPKTISAMFIYGSPGDPSKLTSSELNGVLQRSADILIELKVLEQVLTQLDSQYASALQRIMPR